MAKKCPFRRASASIWADAPTVTLSVGSTNPVGGVTNVGIPAGYWEIDETGAITGWVAYTADTIKLTVVDAPGCTSIIILGGADYTSGVDYAIPEVRVTEGSIFATINTSQSGKETLTFSFRISVAAASTFNPSDGTWLWVTESPYNATGNGTTDDRAAIQACINAAASAGKNVYVPPGTYLCSDYISLPSNIILRGDGATSLLRTTALELVRFTDASHSTLKDLGLGMSYTPANDQSAVWFYGDVSYLTFENVTVTDCGCVAFFGRDATSINYIVWDGCSVSHVGFAGINSGAVGADHCTVKNCIFTDITAAHHQDNPAHGIYVKGWNNLIVEDCVASYIVRSQQGYGWGGYDIEDSTGLTMNRCTAHHCDPAPGGGNGFAFIGTTGTLTDCVADVEVDPGCYYPNSDITFVRFSGTRQT